MPVKIKFAEIRITLRTSADLDNPQVEERLSKLSEEIETKIQRLVNDFIMTPGYSEFEFELDA